MNILGIKPTMQSRAGTRWGGHDPGATLLINGQIASAAEEERFVRIKRAPNPHFPAKSVEFVLAENNMDLSNIDVIAIGRDHSKYVDHIQLLRGLNPLSLRSLDRLYRDLKTIYGVKRNKQIEQIEGNLEKLNLNSFDGQYIEVSHHRSHAASAAFCSGFNNQIIITMDGSGEVDATVIWDADLNRIAQFNQSNSLGRFYSAGCQFLGFRGSQDAGKVMGLASYGEYDEQIGEVFANYTSSDNGQYDVTNFQNGNYEIWIQELGFERSRGEPIVQTHKNFAFHLQLTLEKIVKDLINFYIQATGVSRIAIAGGVAMNCKLNREITNMQVVEDLFVQPVANDTGISLGCALEAHRRFVGTAPEINLNNLYFGPKYFNKDIEAVLNNNKLYFTKYSDDIICTEVAKLLANNKLVGWFQGQMEFGARALGNRSILADPRSHEMRDNVNNNVKKRESWRPFAPSILYEESTEFLKYGDEADYMIILDEVKKSKQKEVAAITHIDGTTRPQTVRKEQNDRYYRLISEFYKITGVPLILNTSFNVAGEPIVESPNQAIADFYRTGLDALAIGDYLLKK